MNYLVDAKIAGIEALDDWLEPCIKIDCEIEYDIEEYIINVSGSLMAEDGKSLLFLLKYSLRAL